MFSLSPFQFIILSLGFFLITLNKYFFFFSEKNLFRSRTTSHDYVRMTLN